MKAPSRDPHPPPRPPLSPQAEANAARGHRSYAETPWLPASAGAPPPAHTQQQQQQDGLLSASSSCTSLRPGADPSAAAAEQQGAMLPLADYAGRSRRVRFGAQAMGMKFETEELQRCRAAEPGAGAYAVDSCVATTAKYGDKFRTLVRSRCVCWSVCVGGLSVWGGWWVSR